MRLLSRKFVLAIGANSRYSFAHIGVEKKVLPGGAGRNTENFAPVPGMRTDRREQ